MPESSRAHPVPQDLLATVAPSSGVLRIPKGECASGVGSCFADAVLVPPPAGASLFRHPARPATATMMTRPMSLELNLICDLHFIDLLDSNSCHLNFASAKGPIRS